MHHWNMKLLRVGGCFALMGWLCAVGFLSNSCSTVQRTVVVPPMIEGASFVGDKSCADCHGNITRAFPASAHARLRLQEARTTGQHGCESCHGPASKHIAVGGAGRDKFIVNPGKDPQTCYQCHLDINAQFHLPQHHPVTEGKMNCVQCHDPHGVDIMKPARGPSIARLDQACSQCHREQTRPFVFEHAAMREGCTTCHNPHGSVNAKLLTIRDSNLCTRCHTIARHAENGGVYIGNIEHTGLLRYGTCWTAGCHSAIHGSNTQPYFFY
jgi:predicted CXXCH cytochrome family protein